MTAFASRPRPASAKNDAPGRSEETVAPIVAAVDGSGAGRAAIGEAVRLARELSAPIVFVYVRSGPAGFLGAPMYQRRLTKKMARAGRVLGTALAVAERAGVEAEGEIREGSPRRRIPEFARDRGAQLIVVGSRGHKVRTRGRQMAPARPGDGLSTRWRMRPREATLRSSESEEDPMTGSIICGVDDSESARGAARVARGLSAKLGSRLVFVRVVADGSSEGEISAVAERLHHLAESAPEVDCGAHWLVEVGHPADRLVAAAKKEAASLIVVGSTGPRSSLLGSISADVSRRAPCPVVVVAPGADQPLTNGNGSSGFSGRTGFPGLSDDGYTGAAPAGFDAAWGPGPANRDEAAQDADAPDRAGGIVRFSRRGEG